MKCFCCGQKAVAIANTCSPTSVSGMTSPRPWCGYCLLSIGGNVNISSWLISSIKIKKTIEDAVKYALTLIEKSVNIANNRRVMARGNRMLKGLK